MKAHETRVRNSVIPETIDWLINGPKSTDAVGSVLESRKIASNMREILPGYEGELTDKAFSRAALQTGKLNSNDYKAVESHLLRIDPKFRQEHARERAATQLFEQKAAQASDRRYASTRDPATKAGIERFSGSADAITSKKFAEQSPGIEKRFGKVVDNTLGLEGRLPFDEKTGQLTKQGEITVMNAIADLYGAGKSTNCKIWKSKNSQAKRIVIIQKRIFQSVRSY